MKMHRALDGRMLVRAPASPAQHASTTTHLGILIFLISVYDGAHGRQKLGLFAQTRLKRDLSALLLRTLVVGWRHRSELIEDALDNME